MSFSMPSKMPQCMVYKDSAWSTQKGDRVGGRLVRVNRHLRGFESDQLGRSSQRPQDGSIQVIADGNDRLVQGEGLLSFSWS